MVCRVGCFWGLKRLLGNPAIDRIFVFNRPYRLVALLTPVLLRLHEAVERELRVPISRAHAGRPVNFEGSDVSRNALAVGRLREACAHAGFRTVGFYPEPIAATLSFLWQRKLTGNGKVLTVDFGGGTLDLSVIRYSGAKFEVLSTAGADLGGDRIDQLIFRRLLFPLLGEGEAWSRQIDGQPVETVFPFAEYEEGILNWAITHTLNQNRYKTRLTELIALGGEAAVQVSTSQRSHQLQLQLQRLQRHQKSQGGALKPRNLDHRYSGIELDDQLHAGPARCNADPHDEPIERIDSSGGARFESAHERD